MTKFRLLLFSGAAVGLLGSATAAFGAPLLPDLHPVVLRDGDNPAYYVDVTSQPGKTLVRFPTHTDNLGAGAFQVNAVAQTGTHTASAQQVIADSDPVTPATVRPLSDLFVNDTGSETWDLQGIAKYTLTPTAGGAPITSALTAMCVSDGDTTILPAPPAVFTAVCRDQALDPAGETVGISPNYFDAYATLSDHTQNYFALTGAAAAPGTSYTLSAMVNPGVTGGVDTAGRIQESNYNNNTDTSPGEVVVPGVAAADVAGGTAQGATPLTIKLGTALTVTAPGTKVGTPSTVPAADTGARSFQIVTQPAKGTATVDPATGVVTFKAAAGQSGADQFTWKATDSRGLVSNVATVTLNVVAPPPPAPSAGGGTSPSGGGSVTPITTPSGGGSTTPVGVTPPSGGGATVGPKLAFAAVFSHGKLVVSFTPKANGTARLTAKSGKTTVATCRTGATAGKRTTCKLTIAKRFAGTKLTISATLQPKSGLAGAAVLHSLKVPAAR